MKQTKLVISVYDKNGELVFSQDPASIDNVRSCIDLWHEDGTEICLAFREVVADEVPTNS